jgi:hypothetical protein
MTRPTLFRSTGSPRSGHIPPLPPYFARICVPVSGVPIERQVTGVGNLGLVSNMAVNQSPYTIEQRLVTAAWLHERPYMDDNMETVKVKF